MITFRRSSHKPVLCIIAINRLVYHQTSVTETSYQTRSRIFQLASNVIRRRGRAYCHVIRYCYYYNNILKALLHNEDGRAWIIPGDVVLNNGSVMVLAGESITVSGALHYTISTSVRLANQLMILVFISWLVECLSRSISWHLARSAWLSPFVCLAPCSQQEANR